MQLIQEFAYAVNVCIKKPFIVYEGGTPCKEYENVSLFFIWGCRGEFIPAGKTAAEHSVLHELHAFVQFLGEPAGCQNVVAF